MLRAGPRACWCGGGHTARGCLGEHVERMSCILCQSWTHALRCGSCRLSLRLAGIVSQNSACAHLRNGGGRAAMQRDIRTLLELTLSACDLTSALVPLWHSGLSYPNAPRTSLIVLNTSPNVPLSSRARAACLCSRGRRMAPFSHRAWDDWSPYAAAPAVSRAPMRNVRHY